VNDNGEQQRTWPRQVASLTLLRGWRDRRVLSCGGPATKNYWRLKGTARLDGGECSVQRRAQYWVGTEWRVNVCTVSSSPSASLAWRLLLIRPAVRCGTRARQKWGEMRVWGRKRTESAIASDGPSDDYSINIIRYINSECFIFSAATRAGLIVSLGFNIRSAAVYLPYTYLFPNICGISSRV